jgi:hypothetical protein
MLNAGGIGMVLLNTPGLGFGDAVIVERLSVPHVRLAEDASVAVLNLISLNNAAGAISAGYTTSVSGAD